MNEYILLITKREMLCLFTHNIQVYIYVIYNILYVFKNSHYNAAPLLKWIQEINNYMLKNVVSLIVIYYIGARCLKRASDGILLNPYSALNVLDDIHHLVYTLPYAHRRYV